MVSDNSELSPSNLDSSVLQNRKCKQKQKAQIPINPANEKYKEDHLYLIQGLKILVCLCLETIIQQQEDFVFLEALW